jgi:uncharacterized protein YjbI with pentapeptide repeats
MDEPKKCGWQDRDGDWNDCEHAATHDDGKRCIFHAQEKDTDEFKAALKVLVQQWIDEKAEAWDFSGFVFPEGIEASNITPVRDEKDKPLFPVQVNFSGATFSGSADFSYATFSGVAFFFSATFSGSADFSDATFSGNAYFRSATFSRDADFRSATFSGSAYFHFAIFREATDFRSATFSQTAYFLIATFNESVYFNNASFAKLGDFEHCSINKYLQWSWPGDGKKWDKEGNEVERGVLRFTDLQFEDGGILDLRRNSLQDDCKLEIHGCKMKNILLEGTDCTQIGFYDNKWPRKQDRFPNWRWKQCISFSRDVVGDEYQIGKLKETYCIEPFGFKNYDPNPALIRRTYQQLARRFREDLDHPRANEFDRGSFEMRRQEAQAEMKAKDGEGSRIRGRSTYFGLSIYKYVSHYSGNLALPLIWWSVLLIACAFSYAVLEYDLVWGWGWPHLCFVFERVMESFRAAFSLVAVDSDSEIVKTIKVMQKVISAVLITLFIFSIRRKFKH